MSQQRIITTSASRFFLSALFFLSLTAAAKLYAGLDSSFPYLMERDAIVPFLTIGQIMVIGAALEIAVGAGIALSKSNLARARILLGFTSLLWMYRLAAVALGSSGRCPCMGSLPQWLGLEDATVEICMWSMLIYLTSGATVIYARSPR